LLIYGDKLFAQDFARWDNHTLTLDNGSILRILNLDEKEKGITSQSLKLKGNPREFLNPGSEEFVFVVNDKKISGTDHWKLTGIEQVTGEYQGNGAVVTLEMKEPGIRIGISYLLYPDLPVIRKHIFVQNIGNKELKLESPDLERLRFRGSNTGTECWVLHDYARQKSLGKFIGNWFDPLVVVHHVTGSHGIFLGNEAPGVMKRTAVFERPDELSIGLTHRDQSFGFRKWLKPGETWESPWVFSGAYANTADPYQIINGQVNDFVRKHMGIRLNEIPEKPTFVYNTWKPFRTKVNAALIREVAKAAADCGIQEFIIDDGWQINAGNKSSEALWGQNYGDWEIDTVKFPGGLKSTFDYIKSLGMKPGLWISIGAATSDAKVFKEHPEWFIKNYQQRLGNVHLTNQESPFHTSCYGTDWFDYIKERVLKLVKEHGLAYAKLDFSVVTSAYIVNDSLAGCYATDHPYHKDREESFLVIYNRVLELFDELHQEAPELFIDCTFETAGKLQLMDYAIARHAEGNWLSNFEEPSPVGSLRVRQMGWWRSPVVPASSLVIGNQQMDDPDFMLSLKSLAGTLPIVLGDPRKLTIAQRTEIRFYADWLKTMQERHNFMVYRQDLPGFGEPAEGHWDGFQRINTDSKSGGIVGVFRHGAAEKERTVTVAGLDPLATYLVLKAPDGKKVARMTGKKLEEEGFEVEFDKKYDGALFEIRK
jgi:alpha-galactosidase